MASPTADILCCENMLFDSLGQSHEKMELVEQFMTVVHSTYYVGVAILASVLGMAGTIWQACALRCAQQRHGRRSSLGQVLSHGCCGAVGSRLQTLSISESITLWLTITSFFVAAGLAVLPTQHGLGCTAVLCFVRYFTNSAFAWTLVRGLQGVRAVRAGVCGTGSGTAAGRSNMRAYHVLAWGVPAVLGVPGLLLPYPPHLHCQHFVNNSNPNNSSSSNNISSTSLEYPRLLTSDITSSLTVILPLVTVLVLCPLLHYRTVTFLMRGRGSYRSPAVAAVRRRLTLVCGWLWLCFVVNLVAATLLWSATAAPQAVVAVLCYAMAIMNPLHGVLNIFVYPGRVARSANSSLNAVPLQSACGCCCWLTCSWWTGRRGAGTVMWAELDDVTVDSDTLENSCYEDLSSSQYHSGSSSPHTMGRSHCWDDSTALLLSSARRYDATPFTFNTKL